MRRRKVKREHIADPDAYCVAGDIADELLPLPIRPNVWGEANMPKNAIDVAIGGKADMPFCTAHVCF